MLKVEMFSLNNHTGERTANYTTIQQIYVTCNLKQQTIQLKIKYIPVINDII